MIIERKIASLLKYPWRKFPILTIVGPRQAGKTTLLKKLFPSYSYYNLERQDTRGYVLENPSNILPYAGRRVIFDEVQNAPQIIKQIRTIIDRDEAFGRYILTGSTDFVSDQSISRQLDGKSRNLTLLPLQLAELPIEEQSDHLQAVITGFYPAIFSVGLTPRELYHPVLQMVLERDIRFLKSIDNIEMFHKFLTFCAGRIGQALNLSSLASDTGISVNTAKSWINLLEKAFIVYLLKPYEKSFNKRIVKAPKLYFYDCGLVSFLLQIRGTHSVSTHHLYSALYKNLIIVDIIKQFSNMGLEPRVYYWKESNGTEIDCIIETKPNEIIALEIRAAENFTQEYLRNLNNFPDKAPSLRIKKRLIHPSAESATIDNVDVMDWRYLGNLLE